MMQDLGGMMAYLLDGKLGEIPTPVEMLWGESDQLMKMSYAQRMHSGLPRSWIRFHCRATCPKRCCSS